MSTKRKSETQQKKVTKGKKKTTVVKKKPANTSPKRKPQKKRATKKPQDLQQDLSQTVNFPVNLNMQELFGVNPDVNFDKALDSSLLKELLEEMEESIQKTKDLRPPSKRDSKKNEENKKSSLDKCVKYLNNLITDGVRSLNPSERDRWKHFIGVEASTRNIAFLPCTKMMEIMLLTGLFNFIVSSAEYNRTTKSPKKYIQTNMLNVVAETLENKFNTNKIKIHGLPKKIVHKKGKKDEPTKEAEAEAEPETEDATDAESEVTSVNTSDEDS